MGDRLRYADVRPYAVPDSLGELVGPANGVVELPAVNALSLRGRVFDAVCLFHVDRTTGRHADVVRVFGER